MTNQSDNSVWGCTRLLSPRVGRPRREDMRLQINTVFLALSHVLAAIGARPFHFPNVAPNTRLSPFPQRSPHSRRCELQPGSSE